MNESEYKLNVVNGLCYHGFVVQCHEDKQALYIPDLSFAYRGADGWIEVKWCEKPPTSLDAIDHWTIGQESWLINRGRAGCGHCYLLVGTPELSAMWNYGVLSNVRFRPFGMALTYVWYKDTLPGLLRYMSETVRRRSPQPTQLQG